MKLILVDTPAQAKRVKHVLGDGWRVEVYMGAVVDLPADALGIDIERGFRPMYKVRQPRIATRLTRAVRKAEAVCIATAPTLEAEAAAWRLLRLAGTPQEKPVLRVVLRGLTDDGIRSALEAAGPLDRRKVEAAETLRAAERLTGWLLTPRLRQATGLEVSIGYLSGIALERITAQPVSAEARWTFRAHFETEAGAAFTADLVTAKGQRVVFDSTEKGDRLNRMLRSAACWVSDIAEREVTAEPPLPYTLKTLIVDSLFSPARTLTLTQALYERGAITCPLLDDAYLLTTGDRPGTEGDAGRLYDRIAEREHASAGEPVQQTVRGALIRAWWERDQSVWLTFRAREREEGPPLGDLDTVRYLDADLLPLAPRAALTEATLAAELDRRGLCDLPASIRTVDALVKGGSAVCTEGRLRLTEAGQAVHDWTQAHGGALFSLDNALRIDHIVSGKLRRQEALEGFWSRLQPVLAAAAPRETPRPLVLYPLEA